MTFSLCFSPPVRGVWLAAEEYSTERVCDTLLMCIITVLNQGLRNGGGVGDILRRPSKQVRGGPLCLYQSKLILGELGGGSIANHVIEIALGNHSVESLTISSYCIVMT